MKGDFGVTEDSKNYYVYAPKHDYDGRKYIVDKETRKVSISDVFEEMMNKSSLEKRTKCNDPKIIQELQELLSSR